MLKRIQIWFLDFIIRKLENATDPLGKETMGISIDELRWGNKQYNCCDHCPDDHKHPANKHTLPCNENGCRLGNRDANENIDGIPF